MTLDKENNFNNNLNCHHFTTDMNLIIDANCQLINEGNLLLKENCENKNKCEIFLDYSVINTKCNFLSKRNLDALENLFFSYSCFSKIK